MPVERFTSFEEPRLSKQIAEQKLVQQTNRSVEEAQQFQNDDLFQNLELELNRMQFSMTSLHKSALNIATGHLDKSQTLRHKEKIYKTIFSVPYTDNL